MIVNKYKILINSLSSGNTVNIPISSNFFPIDNNELIQKEFVEKETEKAINPIIDYEKVRFIPSDPITFNKVSDIVYDLVFKTNKITYSDIGFIDEDIIFRKNKFTKSFLRLSFYDNNVTTNQNLLFFITIFTQLNIDDHRYNSINTINTSLYGIPLPVNIMPIRFRVSDPLTKPSGFAEGYFIHYLKTFSEINNKEIYMRASFNNAKDSKITNFMVTSIPQTIDQLSTNLHIKYFLKKDFNGYYYQIDTTLPNVVYSANTYNVKLYEIDVT